MPEPHRSGCPINLTLEVLGDAWSLLVIRDVVFGRRRHFRQLLTESEEGIATNILADRLRRLVAHDLLSVAPDPSHRQRRIYSLTERSISLVPVLAALGAWGSEHLPVSPELSVRARILADGGPPLWSRLEDELRQLHLGTPQPERSPSVLAELDAAYRAEIARRDDS